MINLLDQALTSLNFDKPVKVSYRDSFQRGLVSRLTDLSLLRLTPNDPPLNLDDNARWRQEKVKQKAVQFIADLDNGCVKNPYVIEGLKLLKSEGRLTSGTNGNLRAKLAETYKPGTAHAQSNQVILLFKLLRLTVETNKFESVINQESLMLPKAMQYV